VTQPIEQVVPLELDSPARGATVARNPIIVAGWTLDKESPLLAVLVSVGDEWWLGAKRGLPRPDVAEALPDLVEYGASTSGWRAELDLTTWPRDRAELKVVVIRANGTWALRARLEVRLRGAPGR
jgi:hypothetical protein